MFSRNDALGGDWPLTPAHSRLRGRSRFGAAKARWERERVSHDGVGSRLRLAIVSDIHYASRAEQARGDYCLCAIGNPLRRAAVSAYRRFIWLRDPFAHNALLDRFIQENAGADFVVANGDYSCDSAFVGISDDAACASAEECLAQLRGAFAARFAATIGDHEFGKKPLGADTGGLRIESLRRCEGKLALEPFWRVEFGRYVLLGVTSSLLGLPVYEPETLPDELGEWRRRSAEHLDRVRSAFASLTKRQRVLLFCHDPTALPFLWRDTLIRSRLGQVEHTIIGHLHSRAVLSISRRLAGMPVVGFLGHTVRRLSTALNEATCWKQFHVTLCPSLAGVQLLKDGGYCTLDLDPDGEASSVINCRIGPSR